MTILYKNFFSIFILILVFILLILVFFAFFTNKINKKTPKIVFITTGIMGYMEDWSKNLINTDPIDLVLAKKSVEEHLVPLNEGEDILFYTLKHVRNVDGSITRLEVLEELIPELYKNGGRFFIGAFTSSEIIALGSFFIEHPDAVLMSTASTVHSLSEIAAIRQQESGIRTNIFRFIPTDLYATPLYGLVIDQDSERKCYVVCYNKEVAFTRELFNHFDNYFGDRILDTVDINNVDEGALRAISLNADLIILADEPRGVDDVPDGFPNSIYMSDIVAFYPYNQERWLRMKTLNVRSFVSRIMHEECEAFGRSVAGKSVSPFIYNILISLWYISDMYLSGLTNIPDAVIEYQKLFRETGETALNHVALVVPGEYEWEIIAGAKHNPDTHLFYYSRP